MINWWFCKENFPGLLAFAAPKNAYTPKFRGENFRWESFRGENFYK